jgi:hypothetical protein
VDNRFVPKEMEDALEALRKTDPEDSFNEGLAVLARLRHRDGGPEPLRQTAFGPLLEHALSTRLEHVASFSGEILAALDSARLLEELEDAIEKDGAEGRLFNAAVLLEETVVPRGEGAEGEK